MASSLTLGFQVLDDLQHKRQVEGLPTFNDGHSKTIIDALKFYWLNKINVRPFLIHNYNPHRVAINRNVCSHFFTFTYPDDNWSLFIYLHRNRNNALTVKKISRNVRMHVLLNCRTKTLKWSRVGSSSVMFIYAGANWEATEIKQRHRYVSLVLKHCAKQAPRNHRDGSRY